MMAATRLQRNRQREENGPDPNGWQIVYTGFVLILLSFFIMLTSFASLQQSRITRFARAFSAAVSVFKQGNSLEPGQTMINGQVTLVDKEDRIALLFEKVRDLGQENGLSEATLRKTADGVVMTLSDKLLFSSGEAGLTPEALPLMQAIGRVLRELPGPVEIQGHTDDQPIHTAVFPSNWELSTARAVNVLRQLMSQQHVDPRWISAVGFAEFQPLVPNRSPQDRAKNRRVAFVFQIQ